MKNPHSVIHWLLTTGSRSAGPAELLEGYCARLRDCGVPVDRSTLGAPLLHPVAQSSYVFWTVEDGARQRWFQWTADALETMRASPIFPIYTKGERARIRLGDPQDRARFPIGEDLWKEGFAEYLAIPLQFSDASWKALTLATRRDRGFTSDDARLVDETLPALAVVFEGFVARNTARTLMETYVGKRAGLRVLDGEIERGDGSRIEAVIWFCDMRGFTRLSESRPDAEVLGLLNTYFEQVIDAIEAEGGEVLKFIGDALLAIFPLEGNTGEAVARAEAAAQKVLNFRADMADDFPAFGIGLHVGSVFYGNIGGGTRLDFTVIGTAVNLASRIESTGARLAKPILASRDFQKNSQKEWNFIGEFDLKGLEGKVPLFELAR